MELINELENDLAFAFLVEKKHRTKIDSKSALALIGKVREVLKSVSKEENPTVNDTNAGKSVSISTH